MTSDEGRRLFLPVLLWTAGIMLAVPVIAVGVLVLALRTSPPPFLPEPVDCEDALGPVGIETLPDHTEAFDCVGGGFRESVAGATVVTSPAALEAWLDAELPGVSLADDGCVEGDRCAGLDHDCPGSMLTASWTLEVVVNDLSDGQVEVRLDAHTV